MLASQFGTLIRDLRARSSLTQEGLARAAKVSRTVLSRLEQGTAIAVQTDVLDRVLAALGASPRVVDASARDDARRLARLEHGQALERRRNRHYRLAVDLAADEKAARAMIARARERVDLWRDKGTCSPYYVDRWSHLLDLPPRALAKAMTSLGDWEDAMFQNSPWSWAWT